MAEPDVDFDLFRRLRLDGWDIARFTTSLHFPSGLEFLRDFPDPGVIIGDSVRPLRKRSFTFPLPFSRNVVGVLLEACFLPATDLAGRPPPASSVLNEQRKI